MKETIKVNLSGQLFDLDSDAYERLRKYLDSLERKFGKNSNSAKEILEDIEARIAELLNAKLVSGKQVVSLTDISEIIGKLGTADEMDDPATESQTQEKYYTDNSSSRRKRMYRDVDHSVIGGVCSGLSYYFNMDPIWIRLIFVGLFFLHLSGVLIYIILWIVIPAAVTTAQKLEMEGKPVNINSISDSLNKEFGKVKSGVRNYANSQEFRNAESALHEVVRIIGQILLVFVKVIGAIIGVSLVMALIVIFLSVILGGFSIASLGIFDHIHWPELWNWQSLSLLAICVILIIIIPIIALMVKLIRWIFGLPGQNQIVSVVGASIWVIAVISLIVLLVNNHEKGVFRNNTKTTATLNIAYPQTLYIDLKEPVFGSNDLEHYQVFDFDFFYDEDDDEFLKKPELEIKRSTDNSCRLEIQREYYHFEVGKVPHDLGEIADYKWQLNDSLLLLDKYYTSEEDEIYRVPVIKLILYVPDGKTIQYSDEVAKILDETDFNDGENRHLAAEQNLKMTSKGLEIVK